VRQAGVRGLVEAPVAGDLEAQQRPPGVVDAAGGGVGAEAAQVGLRHVHPAAVEVLAHVAQEVGELEREAQRARRLAGRRGQGPQHGQHHLADDRRRALHVAAQVVVGLVARGVEVHGHGAEEPVEALAVDAGGPDRVRDGGQRGVRGTPGQRLLERRAERAQPRAGGGDVAGGRPLGVHDVVGEPAQRVHGVHVAALLGGQQQRPPVVRRAVLAGQPGAAGVARRQFGRRGRHPAAAHRAAPARRRPDAAASAPR